MPAKPHVPRVGVPRRFLKTAGAVVTVGVLLVVGLSSCSSVSTATDQVALEYNGYNVIPADQSFEGCHEGGKQSYSGPGNEFVYFPVNQRSFDATGSESSERGPFTVVSDDNAELKVPVSVTFNLTGDCDSLKEFYEKIGRKYDAGMEDGRTNAGWRNMLDFVIGQPLDVTLDRVAQQYDWRKIWNDEAVRVEFENAVRDSLPAQVKNRAGGDYFENFAVLVQKPDPVSEDLKNAIVAEQSGVAKANAAESQAVAQVRAAQAQVAVAQAQAQARQAEIAGYGSAEAYNEAKMIERGLNPRQPSYGSTIVQEPAS